MYQGKSDDQKRTIAQGITKAIGDATGAPPSAVKIFFQEFAREDCAVGGELVSDGDK